MARTKKGEKSKKQLILDLIKSEPNLTKGEIAEQLDVSLPMVYTVVRELRGDSPKKRKDTAPAKEAPDTARFCLVVGGLPNAKKELGKLKDSPSMQFAIAAGGVDEAIKLIEQLEAEIKMG